MVPPWTRLSKRCTKCGEVKPLEAFAKRAAMRDGRRSQCRACDATERAAKIDYERERVTRWRRENPERQRAAGRRQYWADPDRIRTRKRAWHAANAELVHRRKRASYDSAKNRARIRAWRAANPDADRLYLAAHRAEAIERTRRYRARKREALTVPFTAEQLAHRLSMFPGCWVCGGEWSEIDHVKPLAKGGAHCLANLRPICRSHNASKADTWPYPTSVRRMVA
jgi:5-methylcytosine-specific restriction endonuclease McrA